MCVWASSLLLVSRPNCFRCTCTLAVYRQKIHEYLAKYERAFIVGADNVGSRQFMDIRKVRVFLVLALLGLHMREGMTAGCLAVGFRCLFFGRNLGRRLFLASSLAPVQLYRAVLGICKLPAFRALAMNALSWAVGQRVVHATSHGGGLGGEWHLKYTW